MALVFTSVEDLDPEWIRQAYSDEALWGSSIFRSRRFTVAVLKTDSYNGWTVDLGDDEIAAEMGDQLKITTKELGSAINQENVTDRLFARILKNRSKAHQALMDKIPGAAE